MKRGSLIPFFAGLLLVLILLGIVVTNTSNNSPKIVEEKTSEGRRIIQETMSQAKARQITTLYDKVSPSSLGDLENKNLCEITFESDEILPNEEAKGSFKFDEFLWGMDVYLACDQFERYGITEDVLQKVKAGSSTEKLNCDYGRVTTPTIYFYSASDGEDVDYCIAPITINPLKEDEGGCFDEETIDEMKSECDKNDKPYFEIPDSNGCPTIYCGWDYNVCPSEDLLKKAEAECESEENRAAVRYSENVEGQDFPCAQVRCSQCPSEEQREEEKSKCESENGVPNLEMDYETGCEFVFCGFEEVQNPEPAA